VEHRPKPQKSPNLNSPKPILFAIQRKTAEFPQNNFLHLVTLFPVSLRVFPFSKNSSENSNPKNLSNPIQLTAISAHSHRP
jgi:hypothetical protein